MGKPILCLDFDGVLNQYSSGWKGADVIPDHPVPGALEFLPHALTYFRVAIYSSRSGQEGGIKAMQAWLLTWVCKHADCEPRLAPLWLDEIEWPTSKPPAFLTIDDRALNFTGTWPSIESLRSFKTWQQK